MQSCMCEATQTSPHCVPKAHGLNHNHKSKYFSLSSSKLLLYFMAAASQDLSILTSTIANDLVLTNL